MSTGKSLDVHIHDVTSFILIAFAEYYVNLRLCTDTNTKNGVMAHAQGNQNEFYLITDATTNPHAEYRRSDRMMRRLGQSHSKDHDFENIKCQKPEYGKRGFCKWRLIAPIHKQHTELMKIGPIPGHMDKATFWAFNYEARDVLCLGVYSP